MATKSELVEAVAKITGVSKAEANRAVDAVFTTITDNLVKGEDVRLTGFGSFSVAKRAARKGRNPQTGAEIKIPASIQAKFKAGETLKNAVNKKRKRAA
jgi:DNA-binding protein HU-beta